MKPYFVKKAFCKDRKSEKKAIGLWHTEGIRPSSDRFSSLVKRRKFQDLKLGQNFLCKFIVQYFGILLNFLFYFGILTDFLELFPR